MSVTVEFCGLPGAGKSWLAPRVEAGLRRAGLPVHLIDSATAPRPPALKRAASKASLATSQLWRTPALLPVAAAAVIRDPQQRRRDRAPRLLHWLAAQELLQRNEDSEGIYLFDEGPVQALWSIGLWGDHRRLLARLDQAKLPPHLPDVLVVVSAHPEQASGRLAGRTDPHSRLERVGPIARTRHLRRGVTVLEDLVTEWEQRTGRRAVRVDADVPGLGASSTTRWVVVADAIASAFVVTGRVRGRRATSVHPHGLSTAVRHGERER